MKHNENHQRRHKDKKGGHHEKKHGYNSEHLRNQKFASGDS